MDDDRLYNANKELKKFIKPLSKDYKYDLLNEFERNRVSIEFEFNCINYKGGSAFAEEQHEKSVPLFNKSIPVQQLIKSGEVDKKYLHDWQFFINEDYIIARESDIERFYKIDKGMIESMPTSIDNIRVNGFETFEEYCNKSINRKKDLSELRKKSKEKIIKRNR